MIRFPNLTRGVAAVGLAALVGTIWSFIRSRPARGGAPETSLNARGWLRILPSQAMDGFFIARFRQKG